MLPVLATVLAVTIAIGITPQMAVTAFADDGTPAIQLVRDGVAANLEGAQASSVWFGNYTQSSADTKEPVKWRVLQNADQKVFLLSDQNLDCKVYQDGYPSVTWETSSIRTWLNDSFKDAVFSAGEEAAVTETNVLNKDHPYYETPGGEDTKDKVFLLSLEEVTNSAYGFTDGYEPTSTREAKNTEYATTMGACTSSKPQYAGNGYWWLRSPGGISVSAGIVDYDGKVEDEGDFVGDEEVAVRPALHLNLASVLLTSAAEGGKSSGAAGADSLTAVSNHSTNAWKLTLRDNSRDGFDARVAAGAVLQTKEGYSDWSIPVVYSGAKTGENEYVSVILADSKGKALYYGNIGNNSAASPDTGQTVKIPEGLAAGSYTMNLFNEQINGDKRTDYASDFSTIELSIEAPEQQTVSIKNASVVLSKTVFTYNGKVQKPTIKTINGLTLNSGTDFTASWSDASSKRAGTYTVTITGKGNYTGTTKATYQINKDSQTVTVPKTAYTKTFGKAAFSLGAKTNGDGALKYATSNPKVVTVSAAGKVSIKGAGNAKITVYAAAGTNYNKSSKKNVAITVNQAVNPLIIKALTATVNYSAVKKKTQTLPASKVISITTKGQGTITYSKVSGNQKIAINQSTGKVTVKKGLKKGTYKVKVKVKAAGNANYKASAWKTVTFSVIVK